MIVPHPSQRTQQELRFLALLHRVAAGATGESGYDLLLSEPFDILRHKLTNALVQHGSALVEDQVVCIPIVLFKGELGCIVVMDLAYVLGQTIPCFLCGYFCLVLQLLGSKCSLTGQSERTFRGAFYVGRRVRVRRVRKIW